MAPSSLDSSLSKPYQLIAPHVPLLRTRAEASPNPAPLPVWGIVLIALAGVAVVLAVVFVAYLLKRRRRHERTRIPGSGVGGITAAARVQSKDENHYAKPLMVQTEAYRKRADTSEDTSDSLSGERIRFSKKLGPPKLSAGKAPPAAHDPTITRASSPHTLALSAPKLSAVELPAAPGARTQEPRYSIQQQAVHARLPDNECAHSRSRHPTWNPPDSWALGSNDVSVKEAERRQPSEKKRAKRKSTASSAMLSTPEIQDASLRIEDRRRLLSRSEVAELLPSRAAPSSYQYRQTRLTRLPQGVGTPPTVEQDVDDESGRPFYSSTGYVSSLRSTSTLSSHETGLAYGIDLKLAVNEDDDEEEGEEEDDKDVVGKPQPEIRGSAVVSGYNPVDNNDNMGFGLFGDPIVPISMPIAQEDNESDEDMGFGLFDDYDMPAVQQRKQHEQELFYLTDDFYAEVQDLRDGQSGEAFGAVPGGPSYIPNMVQRQQRQEDLDEATSFALNDDRIVPTSNRRLDLFGAQQDFKESIPDTRYTNALNRDDWDGHFLTDLLDETQESSVNFDSSSPSSSSQEGSWTTDVTSLDTMLRTPPSCVNPGVLQIPRQSEKRSLMETLPELPDNYEIDSYAWPTYKDGSEDQRRKRPRFSSPDAYSDQGTTTSFSDEGYASYPSSKDPSYSSTRGLNDKPNTKHMPATNQGAYFVHQLNNPPPVSTTNQTLSIDSETLPDLAKHFTCDDCQKIFVRRCDLRKHRKTHNPETPCPGCDRVFQDGPHMRRHLLSKHPELSTREQFHCPHTGCNYAKGGKSFARNETLVRHVKNIHKGQMEVS